MEKIKCPVCNGEVYGCLDGWGHTPFHLHCDNCEINIGATSHKKCVELLNEYARQDLWIEYYKNDIQLMVHKGKFIIDKETKK